MRRKGSVELNLQPCLPPQFFVQSDGSTVPNPNALFVQVRLRNRLQQAATWDRLRSILRLVNGRSSRHLCKGGTISAARLISIPIWQ